MNRITRLQQRLSDRVHARGDAFAEQAGWTTTTTTGRFGFGARVYQDARCDQRRMQAGREDTAPAMDWPTSAALNATTQPWRTEAAPTWPGPHEADWAGTGFSRPGPAEPSAPSREMFRAALQDALASAAGRDSCDKCDGVRLCGAPTSRAARAEQYKQALEQEMDAGP